MFTLRPALKDELLRELDHTSFGKDLFEIKIQKEDYLLSLTFIPKNHFSFTLKSRNKPKGIRDKFLTIEAPGLWMLEPDEFSHENFGQARGRISSWARRIEDDYKASLPGYEDLETFRSQILTEFNEATKGEGVHFSDKEKKNIEKKLKSLQEKMEALYKDKDASQQQIQLMKQQISQLKTSVEILDKRTWVLAAANRVINIYKEVRAAVGEVKTITTDFNKLLPIALESEASNSQDDNDDE